MRVLSVSLCFLSIMTGVCAAEDLQTGFGGVTWETALDQVADCEKTKDQAGLQYCIRRHHAHTLMGELAPDVLYGFYQNSFFAVFIGIENDEAYVLTKNRLIDRLGTPQTSFDKEGVASTFRWKEGHVRVELYNDRSKEGFRLVYIYLPIADKALRKHKTLNPSKQPTIKFFPQKWDEDSDSIGILEF
jgi:hypothetical protein